MHVKWNVEIVKKQVNERLLFVVYIWNRNWTNTVWNCWFDFGHTHWDFVYDATGAEILKIGIHLNQMFVTCYRYIRYLAYYGLFTILLTYMEITQKNTARILFNYEVTNSVIKRYLHSSFRIQIQATVRNLPSDKHTYIITTTAPTWFIDLHSLGQY